MRKGIADLHRRAEVSQKATERYLDAFAAMDDSTSLQELLDPIEKHVTWNGKRVRAMHPFDGQDKVLLESISRGEYVINGLRNRDLQNLLYASDPKSEKESRQRSAAISRKLRMLRAHHLISKVSGTHRYQVTATGRPLAMGVIAASNATVNMLIPKAA